jgi:hypothetical protein
MTAADENAKSLPPADGTAADIPVEQVRAELAGLRKGAGVEEPALARRIGPYLRELASLGGQPTDSAALRRQLRTELTACAARLPGEARIAVTAGLALSDAARQAKLIGRRLWLAKALSVSPRTAQRRLDDGEALLAEEIALELRGSRGRAAAAPRGWYLDEFRAVLRLDTPAPQSLEHRRIIATRADLQEIMAWADVPGDAPGQQRPKISAEVTYGGRLIKREQPSPGRYQFVVRLPVALQSGDQHEYGLAMQLPEGQPMRPHAIFVPECVCNVIDITVRFDLGRLPAWVRRVDGEPVRVFDAAQPPKEVVIPDESGEVHARFTTPAMNLGYGLQWQL